MTDSEKFQRCVELLTSVNNYVSNGAPTPEELEMLHEKLDQTIAGVLTEAHRLRTELELAHEQNMNKFNFIPYGNHNPFCRAYNEYDFCQGECKIDMERLKKYRETKNNKK